MEKIGMKEYKEFIENSNGKIIVDFYADWCNPCRTLSPILEKLEREMPDVKFYRCNVDEEMQLAAYFGIDSIPAVYKFIAGKTSDVSVGYKDESGMREFIEED